MTNVGAAPDGIDVYLFAAGMDPKSTELDIQQTLLTVSGERQVPVSERATYHAALRCGRANRPVVESFGDKLRGASCAG